MPGKFNGTRFNSIRHGHTVGLRRTRTHQAWTNMLTRVRNPKATQAQHYSQRGITVCERWLVFENFLADMGECPAGLTLERRDNSKGYGPDNCYWASKKEQANNRRTNRIITYSGISRTLAQWAEHLGVGPSTIGQRLRSGWSVEKALTQEVRPCR